MAVVLLEGFDAMNVDGDGTTTHVYPYVQDKHQGQTHLTYGALGYPGWASGRCIRMNNNNTNMWIPVPAATTYYLGFASRAMGSMAYNSQVVSVEGAYIHGYLDRWQGDVLRIRAAGVDVGRVIGVTQYKQWAYYELKWVVHDTEGQVEVRINGNTVFQASDIDTRNGTGDQNIWGFRFPYCNGSEIDDIYVSNSGFLGPLKIEALLPSGAGSSAGWTPSAGNNYACVDEIPKNGDTDYVSAGAAATDLHACGNLSNITGNIKAVQLNVDAKTESDATNIRTKCKSGSTTADGASQSVADATNFDTICEVEEVDPDTAAAWTASGVNGMEIGYEHLG